MTINLDNTMTPTKPEDYETAIPQDPKFLREEVEKLAANSSEEPFWLRKNRELQKQNTPKTVKCTCAKQFYTKKRRKKNVTVISRTSNGYTNQGCPVHFHR